MRIKTIKKQRSLHISENLDMIIQQRCLISKRKYSAEIEFIIEKYLASIIKSDREALDLAEKARLKLSIEE